ncbi:MAG: sugar phosphate isomerase/epimerase [Chloroflexi bacterium OHK40]
MQLGLFHEIRPGDDLPRLTDQVAAMGFASLHAHFPAGCDEALARRLSRSCAGSGLAIAAVSGYANPLRPDEAPMGFTLAQLASLIALLPLLDTRRVVSWSGTYGAGLFDDHPDNRTPAAWEVLHRSVDELFPVLEAAEAVLVIEPLFAHVLDGPARLVRFCEEANSPYLRVVLDPPNMLPPDTWARQAELIAAAVDLLAPYVGLVHLKDMRLQDGRLDLPGPGQGVLDYPAFFEALARAEISAPAIVEHVTLAQAPAARRFVLAQAAAARL